MTQPETNTGLLVEFDSVRMCSNLVTSTRGHEYQSTKNDILYKQNQERVQGCRKKNKVAYALALNIVRSGTRSKYREIEHEVVLDNHKQRWPTTSFEKVWIRPGLL
jgi:hypothetical protein